MKKEEIKKSLAKLEEITRWFESREVIDVEEALKKVREGGALIKDLKKRVSQVENEFREIKKDFELED